MTASVVRSPMSFGMLAMPAMIVVRSDNNRTLLRFTWRGAYESGERGKSRRRDSNPWPPLYKAVL